MAGYPSLPLFVKDYLVDTTHLTLEQSGAFLHLLMHAWQRGGELPDNDRQLAAFCKCSLKKWKALRADLEPFFCVQDGAWINKRLAQEWQYVRDVSEKRAAAGARGGASKPRDNKGLPKQMLKQNASKTEAPRPIPITEDTNVSSLGRGTRLNDDWLPGPLPDDFDCPDEIARCQLPRFRDYWIAQPGQKGVKRDWDATWRNWLRRAMENDDGRQRQPMGRNGGHSAPQYRRDPAWERLKELHADVERNGWGSETIEGDEGGDLRDGYPLALPKGH